MAMGSERLQEPAVGLGVRRVLDAGPPKAFLLALTLCSLFIHADIASAVSPTNNPAACSDNASTGTVTWVSPGNAVSSNNVFATAGLSGGITAHYLMATGFSFSIPTNAVVDGITASVRRKSSGGTLRDVSVRIVKAGSITGSNKASAATWPTTVAYASYGGVTDLWGTAWTPQDINSNRFGFVVSVKNAAGGNRTASIDHMRLAVTYRLPPLVNNDGGASNIVATTVTMNGNVLAGDPAPTAYFFWGTIDGGTNRSVWSNSTSVGPTNGFFSTTRAGLLASTQYWYRCYVSNSLGTVWATSSTNFMTLAPGLTISDVTVVEGPSASTTNAVFLITLSATNSVNVTFTFATSNGTATAAGNDYTATNGTLTMVAGQTSTNVTVKVIGDNSPEGSNETFYVNLGNVTNATLVDGQGLGIILDDDGSPVFRFQGTPYSVSEAGGSQQVTVAISGPSELAMSVSYATSNGSAVAGAGGGLHQHNRRLDVGSGGDQFQEFLCSCHRRLRSGRRQGLLCPSLKSHECHDCGGGCGDECDGGGRRAHADCRQRWRGVRRDAEDRDAQRTGHRRLAGSFGVGVLGRDGWDYQSIGLEQPDRRRNYKWNICREHHGPCVDRNVLLPLPRLQCGRRSVGPRKCCFYDLDV